MSEYVSLFVTKPINGWLHHVTPIRRHLESFFAASARNVRKENGAIERSGGAAAAGDPGPSLRSTRLDCPG